MTPLWTTSCLDWNDRLKQGKSIIPPPIFPERAQEALAIFKQLKIVDAPGSPTFGEACAQWVFDLVACIFGAYDAESGRRLITEFFVMVPKKNAKSSIAAGIMMTALILNWRQSAEFTILAPTIEVASNSFSPSRDMVKHDEELSDLMQVQTHIKTITHRISDAILKVLAADANTVGGKKSVGTLVDELHLFGKMANAESMFVEALGGLAARPEGFVIWLTTQSDEPPAGIFRQKLQYARDVRDGIVHDPQFVPVIYEFPQDMLERKEHLNPVNFGLVNPNLNYSVDGAFLERELKKAQQTGEESVRGFLAKHLNVEIGLALRSDRWAGADFWEAAGRKLSLDSILDRSDVVVVGIDGGGLDDLLGLCVLGRDRNSREWLHWGHAWAHEIVLERRKEIAPALQGFAKDGDLTIVAQPGDDVQDVADIICEINARGLLPVKNAIGVDAVGIGDIIDELTTEHRGIAMEQIIGISQGWKLNGAIKTAERKLAGGEMVHCSTRLMAWCVGNARTVASGNAIGITKQASGTAKIDPLMATFNAVSLMSLNPEGQNIDDFISTPIRA